MITLIVFILILKAIMVILTLLMILPECCIILDGVVCVPVCWLQEVHLKISKEKMEKEESINNGSEIISGLGIAKVKCKITSKYLLICCEMMLGQIILVSKFIMSEAMLLFRVSVVVRAPSCMMTHLLWCSSLLEMHAKTVSKVMSTFFRDLVLQPGAVGLVTIFPAPVLLNMIELIDVKGVLRLAAKLTGRRFNNDTMVHREWLIIANTVVDCLSQKSLEVWVQSRNTVVMRLCRPLIILVGLRIRLPIFESFELIFLDLVNGKRVHKKRLLHELRGRKLFHIH